MINPATTLQGQKPDVLETSPEGEHKLASLKSLQQKRANTRQGSKVGDDDQDYQNSHSLQDKIKSTALAPSAR